MSSSAANPNSFPADRVTGNPNNFPADRKVRNEGNYKKYRVRCRVTTDATDATGGVEPFLEVMPIDDEGGFTGEPRVAVVADVKDTGPWYNAITGTKDSLTLVYYLLKSRVGKDGWSIAWEDRKKD